MNVEVTPLESAVPNVPIAPVNEERVTPRIYFAEIVAMSLRHPAEFAVGVGGIIVITLISITMLWRLHLVPLGGPLHLLSVLLPPLAAMLVFQAAVACWRLYRRQWIALATTRSLLELDAGDRADFERHLHRRYRRREARIAERNNARLERLGAEIATLRSAVIRRQLLDTRAAARAATA